MFASPNCKEQYQSASLGSWNLAHCFPNIDWPFDPCMFYCVAMDFFILMYFITLRECTPMGPYLKLRPFVSPNCPILQLSHRATHISPTFHPAPMPPPHRPCEGGRSFHSPSPGERTPNPVGRPLRPGEPGGGGGWETYANAANHLSIRKEPVVGLRVLVEDS